MTVNKIIRIIFLCLAFATLFACRKDKAAELSNAKEMLDPLLMETELNILALDGRIESGKNSAAFDWVSPFETATGCKVKATQLDSHELLAEKLEGNQYDLIIAADSSLPENLFQTIDFSRIRSFKNLDKRFLENPAVQKKIALPLHWKQIPPVPPSTELITEVESTHLLAKAKNINCTYAWMEWTLSPKVQADIAAALDTIPVVPAACVGNELLGDDACKQRMADASVSNKFNL
jgi:spermidine/putrescine-binding protein